jgi:hypothetical protein
LLELIFINLCDSSNEDGIFFPSSKVNYLGSNVPLASWASISQCDLNLKKNHVSCHWSPQDNVLDFEYINSIEDFKHHLHKKCCFPIDEFQKWLLFELLPLHQPIKHFGQMQGMDWKYDGHA